MKYHNRSRIDAPEMVVEAYKKNRSVGKKGQARLHRFSTSLQAAARPLSNRRNPQLKDGAKYVLLKRKQTPHRSPLANIKSVEAVAAVEAAPEADLLTPASEIGKPSEAVEELVRGLPFPESHNNDRTLDVTTFIDERRHPIES